MDTGTVAKALEAKDWIALGSALVAVIFGSASVIAAVLTRRIAMGQAETGLRASIRATRESVRSIAIKIAEVRAGKTNEKLTPAQEGKLDVLEDAFAEATEDNLNAYEDACAKYLDKKIDRERFKRMYYSEIENLGRVKEGNVIHKFMYPEQQSRFKAIWKVFHQWTNLEK
jgi:hypothetical protein